ncbi:cytochrome b5 [Conidiobolus coronatus NRRL 28638]|uniref:Cytochrome b5 n=1 Tax=Conidiobolus coronatus (strain ATCC 28846 / CBS 209.66 / NRRL 28638) TaxID=796925 RepID=A0A137P9H5_CONC2|nr:cytochrome b5 [Conidiobolus coronatus NRRL 28638]|eukprot:KXN71561.1 cytochrome b5 [Conidiobolus coronatus NRRL 28638]
MSDNNFLSPYRNVSKDQGIFPLPNGPQMASGPNKTGKSRNKVALEPGYSQMDWVRLTTSGKDLRGVTEFRLITLEELSQHKAQDDAWCAIDNKVYNITHYLKFHPGGVKQAMRGAGKDCTELFYKTHAWVSVDSLLKECCIGILKR